MSNTQSASTKTNMIVEGALSVALAWALSYLKIDLWFQGGSVDLVMVPIIIFAMRRGLPYGLGAGLVFGTIKYFLAGGFAVSWQSMLLDYTVAYMFVGFSGIFKGAKNVTLAAVWASIVAGLARFAVHYASGVTIYAIYTEDTFLGLSTGGSAWFYSLLYNGSYMLPNTIAAVVVIAALSKVKPIENFIRGGKIY